MKKTYLFFDIECANCFDNEGKICSFGYALCDKDFNVIENKDIIINPKAPFDPYLFRKNSTCHLAYTKSEFLAHEDFSFYYDEINSLLSKKGITVLGFGVDNDVDFISSECLRYGEKLIEFSSYDIHPFLVNHFNEKGGLDFWKTYFKIDNEEIKMHRSSDDALSTLLVAKVFCENEKITLEKFITGLQPPLTSKNALMSHKTVLYNKIQKAKIKHAAHTKPNSFESKNLNGKYYFLSLNKNVDSNLKLQITKDIVNNGGRISDYVSRSCSIIMADGTSKPNWIKGDNEIVFLKDLYSLIEKKESKLYTQKPLPKDFDYSNAKKELSELTRN